MPMMTMSTAYSPLLAANKSWTGVTTGLQVNLLNAPPLGTYTWNDASGNGRHATLQGKPTYIYGNGGGIKLCNVNYSGSDFISVPYNLDSSTCSIEMVASFNPTSNWATIWGNDNYNSNAGYLAYLGSSTSIYWGKPSTGGASYSIPAASNSTKHWVFVINGTTGKIYVNGTEVSSSAITNQTSFTTNNFYFGSRHMNDGTGSTDRLNNTNALYYPIFYQMRIYNTALSAANVTTNYAAVKSSVTGGYGLP